MVHEAVQNKRYVRLLDILVFDYYQKLRALNYTRTWNKTFMIGVKNGYVCRVCRAVSVSSLRQNLVLVKMSNDSKCPHIIIIKVDQTTFVFTIKLYPDLIVSFNDITDFMNEMS